MDKEAPKRLRSFISAIKKKLGPAKVNLFGSRARDDYLQESDYDLIVVSNHFKDVDFPERITKTLELLKKPIE